MMLISLGTLMGTPIPRAAAGDGGGAGGNALQAGDGSVLVADDGSVLVTD